MKLAQQTHSASEFEEAVGAPGYSCSAEYLVDCQCWLGIVGVGFVGRLAIGEFEFGTVGEEVMAHAREFDVGGAAGMKIADRVNKIARFAGTSDGVSGAKKNEDRKLDLLPLAGKT